MSQTPNNMYNNTNGNSNSGGQPQGRPTMGAWQPAAPTSLQMSQQGQQQQQQPQQQYSQQQQQQQYSQQQQRAGPYGVPQTMAPYGYHPYYAQQAPPQPGPQRVGGWNPTYGGAPMYHQAPPPNMYYGQQQQSTQQSSRQPQQQQGAMPNQQLPPQQLGRQVPPPRPKKALVITDKDGNPIDLSGVKKSGSKATEPAVKETKAAAAEAPKAGSTTEKATTAASVPAAKDAGMDAGAKMRQLAMERIQGKVATEKKAAEETKEAAAPEPKKEPTPEPKKEATPAPKKEPTPEPKKEATPAVAPKKEPTPEPKKEAAPPKLAPPPGLPPGLPQKRIGGGGSLASMLAKQETEKKEEEKVLEEKADKELPEGETNLKINAEGKKRHVYSKEEMMRLKALPVCVIRPDDLPELEITKGPSRTDGARGGGGGGGGGGGRNRGGDGGGSNSWQRGAAPPRRQSTETGGGGRKNDGGGGQWARGVAPPPRPKNKGGKGSADDFFDGPVAPLQKSKNGWKPNKDTSLSTVAEKKVKGILNKMTKEKFDRLATQMLEIPIVNHEILTMMIHNVYEKAIDEPSFGDMYGDLCVKLSQLKSSSYIQIIESDEEPPTEDGEAGGGQGESSAHSVYRWSNDVDANDSEIVGPYSTVDECLEVALSDEEQERKERGEMELVIHKLLIKKGIFIKIMKKKVSDGEEEKEETEFYTVYFPVADAQEVGQQMSKIFLSEPECVSDSTKQNSFKRSLLNKCEDEFNKQDIYEDWKKEKKAYEESKSSMTQAERAEKEEELEFRRIKIKKQMLGNIKFIGQLYKKSLLKEKIMRYCIASLLKLECVDDKGKLPVYKDTGEGEAMDEEDHEAVCSMFSTIGSTIDRSHAADFIEVCFDKIAKLGKDKKLPSRSRFMYKDLLDLRANRWVPRRKVEKAKTLEEIRKDVEREEKLQAQQSAQNNYRGGGGGGRNSNYGGKSNNDRSRNSYNNSNNRRQSKPTQQTDDDGFTTISAGAGIKARPSASQRPSTQKTSNNSKSSSGKSAYAALAEQPTPTKKAAPEALSSEKLERRIKSIRGEYIQDPSNLSELLLSVDELSGTPDSGTKFVQLNSDRIIDCKDDERAAIYSMLSILVEKKKLSPSDVKAGVVDLIEFIDSYVYDAPKAFDYLGDLLTAMYNVKAVDVAWICEQAKKTEISSKENPEKIIRALAGAMEAKNGKDGMKTALSDPSVSNLLGDRWEEVRGSIM